MITKLENCIYCGAKMKSIRASKKFCCDLHKLYYNREIKRGSFVPPVIVDELRYIKNLPKYKDNPDLLNKDAAKFSPFYVPEPTETIDPLQDWKDELNNCESGEEINYVGQKIATSGLSRLDQNILTKYGKHICEIKSFL